MLFPTCNQTCVNLRLSLLTNFQFARRNIFLRARDLNRDKVSWTFVWSRKSRIEKKFLLFGKAITGKMFKVNCSFHLNRRWENLGSSQIIVEREKSFRFRFFPWKIFLCELHARLVELNEIEKRKIVPKDYGPFKE